MNNSFLKTEVLNKLSSKEVIEFIEEDPLVLTGITTKIYYRLVGNFCFMLHKNKLDNTTIGFDIFYLSPELIQSFIHVGSIKSPLYTNAEASYMMSGKIPTQFLFTNFVDHDVDLNKNIDSPLPQFYRVSGIIQCPTIIRKEDFKDQINAEYYGSHLCSLESEGSMIAPSGYYRTALGRVSNKRYMKVVGNHVTISEVVSKTEEGFSINGVKFGPWPILLARTPFNGEISLLVSRAKTSVKDIRPGDLIITGFLSEVTASSIPFVHKDIGPSSLNDLNRVLNKAIEFEPYFKALEKHMCSKVDVYYDGVCVAETRDMAIEFLKFLRNKTLKEDKNAHPQICTIKETNSSEFNYVKYLISNLDSHNKSSNYVTLNEWKKITKEKNANFNKKDFNISIEPFLNRKNQQVVLFKDHHYVMNLNQSGQITEIYVNFYNIYSLLGFSGIPTYIDTNLSAETLKAKKKIQNYSPEIFWGDVDSYFFNTYNDGFMRVDYHSSIESNEDMKNAYKVYTNSVYTALKNYIHYSKTVKDENFKPLIEKTLHAVGVTSSTDEFKENLYKDHWKYNLSVYTPFVLDYFLWLGFNTETCKKEGISYADFEDPEEVAIKIYKNAMSGSNFNYKKFPDRIDLRNMEKVFEDMSRFHRAIPEFMENNMPNIMYSLFKAGRQLYYVTPST